MCVFALIYGYLLQQQIPIFQFMSVHLTLSNSFHSHEYGKNQSQMNLRMRKQNTNTTVLVDVVPERRTERFPPRFRPVGRSCVLRFIYLSSPTGREGEISRHLDHMRQISFIHSARLIDSTNFYIYRTVFQIFSQCGTLRCVLMQSSFNNCARALAKPHKAQTR